MDLRQLLPRQQAVLRMCVILTVFAFSVVLLHNAYSIWFVPTIIEIPSVSAAGQNNGSKLSIQTNRTLPVCSHSLLRSLFTKHHRFPEVEMNGRYALGTCKFLKCDIFTSLKSKGIDSIFLLGDSQGKRGSSGLVRYLKSLPGVTCSKKSRINIENRFQSYFSRGGVTVRTVANESEIIKACSSCICTTYICERNNDDFKIKVEYVGAFEWHGTPVIVSGYPGLGTFQCSFIEYLFKYYLKKSYPAIVVVFSLFNHLKRDIPIEKSAFQNNLLPFLDLLNSTLPNSSRILWLTNPMEFEETKIGAAEAYKGRRYGGYLAGEVMYIFSRWLYDTLADYLVQPESHQLGFFNVANMTSSLVERSLDGTHMDNQWYDEFMGYMMNTLCNGL